MFKLLYLTLQVTQSCPTVCNPIDNTGVGSNSLPQGISQPKDQTQVSRIADNSLPATREAQITVQLCSFHTLAR